MDITEYWKTIIGITLGLSFLVFGLAFWNSATADDYTSKMAKSLVGSFKKQLTVPKPFEFDSRDV